jgi:hypothetical protein
MERNNLFDRATELLHRRLDAISTNMQEGILNELSEGEKRAADELMGIAEHARKVDADKASLVMKAIGLRAQSLTPEQVATLMEGFGDDPLRLLGETEPDK